MNSLERNKLNFPWSLEKRDNQSSNSCQSSTELLVHNYGRSKLLNPISKQLIFFEIEQDALKFFFDLKGKSGEKLPLGSLCHCPPSI